MQILLDSHAFVWFVLGDKRCSIAARDVIQRQGVAAHISAVTAWEIATKVRIGKWVEALDIAKDIDAIVLRWGFVPLPVTVEHGRIAGFFDSPHKDPFDRMLAAQAQVEAMPLVTSDQAFETFDVRTIW